HAARGVAASIALAAIGIPDAHIRIAAHRTLQRDDLVAADPAFAISYRPRLRVRKRQRPTRTCVKNDEIIAAAVHLEIAHLAQCRRYWRLTPRYAAGDWRCAANGLSDLGGAKPRTRD